MRPQHDGPPLEHRGDPDALNLGRDLDSHLSNSAHHLLGQSQLLKDLSQLLILTVLRRDARRNWDDRRRGGRRRRGACVGLHFGGLGGVLEVTGSEAVEEEGATKGLVGGSGGGGGEAEGSVGGKVEPWRSAEGEERERAGEEGGG